MGNIFATPPFLPDTSNFANRFFGIEEITVGTLPKVMMKVGLIMAICASRKEKQTSISWDSGFRFPGGRHFTMLAINTSSRVILTDF